MSQTVEFTMFFGQDNELSIIAEVGDSKNTERLERGHVDITQCKLIKYMGKKTRIVLNFEPEGLGVWNRHLNKYESLMDDIADAAHEKLEN
tara:strand:- start:6514 stop:6786 length:273 start_codon:yes stop_codon:yes gene_type:complete